MILLIQKVECQMKDKFKSLQRLIVIITIITLINAKNYKDQII